LPFEFEFSVNTGEDQLEDVSFSNKFDTSNSFNVGEIPYIHDCAGGPGNLATTEDRGLEAMNTRTIASPNTPRTPEESEIPSISNDVERRGKEGEEGKSG
jgi:hypothetical protein